MVQHPRIRAHYQVEAIDGERVILLGETGQYVLEGPLMVRLLPILDGTRSVDEIVAALCDEHDVFSTYAALTRLERAGHLTEGAAPDLDPRTRSWMDSLGISATRFTEAAPSFRVAVVGTGDIDPEPVVTDLAAMGVAASVRSYDSAINGGGDGDSFTLVLVDDYLRDGLSDLNAAFLAGSRSWGLAKPTGGTLWWGPFFDQETGCWQCLEQRLAANRQVERYVLGKRGGEVPRLAAGGWSVAGSHIVAATVGAALCRLISGVDCELSGVMRTFEIGPGVSRDHQLIAQPQCPACGDVRLATRSDSKVVLARHEATSTTDGGYRICPPSATYARLCKHISPLIGAITGLSAFDETTDDGITYSYAAGHNFAMFRDDIDNLRRNMRSQSGGKGRSPTQAKVSAICEALERYSAVWRGDERSVRASYQELGAERAVHPARLALFSDAQYEHRDEWNKDVLHRLHVVPERFREDLPIEWVSGWSLTSRCEALLPAAYIWYGHPDLKQHFFCTADSNGSASGNTLEEAVLQGICELIERDAVAIWWYNKLEVPGVDLDSFGDPYVQMLRDYYAQMDRAIWVLDITSDLGVPAFAACSSRDHEVEDVMVGFGAHPDARVAVMRALTELNQFLPVVRRRDAEGNTSYLGNDPEMIGWAKEVKLADNPWLLPDPKMALRSVGDFDPTPSHDLVDCIDRCVDAVARAGVEVMVCDLSRPEIELSVVKVVAPGLRHFWRRTGPGRLYDVPVAMGMVAEPTAEADLNDRNVFF